MNNRVEITKSRFDINAVAPSKSSFWSRKPVSMKFSEISPRARINPYLTGTEGSQNQNLAYLNPRHFKCCIMTSSGIVILTGPANPNLWLIKS